MAEPMKWKRDNGRWVSGDYHVRTKIGVGIMEGETRYAAYWLEEYFGSSPTMSGAKHLCSDHAASRQRNRKENPDGK